jgi:hypothetical protein
MTLNSSADDADGRRFSLILFSGGAGICVHLRHLRIISEFRTSGGLHLSRVTCSLLLVALAVLPFRVVADGGLVRISQEVGPFVVTVFTAPTPLRAGTVDISAMVQWRENREPVLDAALTLALQPRDSDAPPLHVAATREQATNKLLYAALVDVPAAGPWALVVTVTHPDVPPVQVGATLDVHPPRPAIIAFWPYLLFPPLAILLFVLHQGLRARR